jgi:hypothetical protein
MKPLKYMRDLSAPGQKRAIRDLLQGIFVAELIRPSSRLWFASGWVSDIEILDNTARQISALYPDWPASTIRLSKVFAALADKRGELVVILRDVKHNYPFISKIKELRNLFPGIVHLIVEPDFHEKGILGDDYFLSGSMNFTHNGIYVNSEHLIYRCDPASVRERRIVMEEKWGGHLGC